MGEAMYVIIVLLCLVYCINASARVDPLVETNLGFIRGQTAPDGEYSMFLGIPYATVNSSNPFGPSIPHEDFEGIFNAYDDSAACPQREEFNGTLTGTLDCLHLNIYVPRTASTRNPVPVLVWLHGGAFVRGSGGKFIYGPKYLVRHDVIVVTLNYRVGAYGFLCLNTPEVPGNQGLKDQLIALRWVKNHIGAFGGNNNRITLGGGSAGAASVDFHLIYTQENLFRNVIMQSGTALLPVSTVQCDPSAALRIAQYLGFITDDVERALEYLNTADTNLVVAAAAETVTLKACVEQEFENVERYIAVHPTQMKITNARTKPILIGFNNNEFAINFDRVNPYETWNAFAAMGEYFDYDSLHLDNMVDNVGKFYIGDEDVNDDVHAEISNFRSDFTFLHPTYRSIQKYFENGASRIYHYLFSYNGGRNFLKRRSNVTYDGAFHTDDIGYVFDTGLFTETPTAEDQLVIDRITTMWTNFVKHSNPTPEVTDLLPVRWPVYISAAASLLNIDLELNVQQPPFYERMAFWDLFYKLHEAYSRQANANPFQDLIQIHDK